MIAVPLIDWQPMAVMPMDRRDGRQVLLWYFADAVVAQWKVEAGGGYWDTGFASEIDGDPIAVERPEFWADINPLRSDQHRALCQVRLRA